MKVTIDVTQEDINHGIQGDCGRCPVARAIIRRTTVPVRVDGEEICFPGLLRLGVFPVPESVAEFVNEFDDLGCEGVSPFSFELDIPDSLLATN